MKMKSSLLPIIESYLNQVVDYGIMINGAWGCGKTYYIENTLKKYIAENFKDFDFIYVSVFGFKLIEEININIMYKLLDIHTLHDKSKLLRNVTQNDMFANVCSIISSFPNAGITKQTGSLVTAISTLLDKKAFDKINLKKVFLVIDDIERATDRFCLECLGRIYEGYIKNGCHVLFLTDESQIESKNYKTVKEKVIRRTIEFDITLDVLLEELITSRYKETQLVNFWKNENKWIIEDFKQAGVKNLRSISFVLDNFLQVICGIDEGSFGLLHLKDIFENVLIFTNEYKEGKIDSQDLKERKNLSFLSPNYGIYFLSDKKEEEKTYADFFYEQYIKGASFQLALIPSIFDFTITGILDSQTLNRNINYLYAGDDPSMVAIEKIHKIKEMEESEVSSLVTEIVEYCREGKYPLIKIPSVYSNLRYVKESGYLENFDEDIEAICNKSIDMQLRTGRNILPDYDRLYYISPNHWLAKDEKYLRLISKINQIIDENLRKTEKEQMIDLLGKINLKSFQYWEIRDFPLNGRLFEKIVEHSLDSYLFDLTNHGIYFFEVYIYNNISNVSNAGAVLFLEHDPLEKIANSLKENLIINPKPKMSKKRIEELIIAMQDAVKHLEDTKKDKQV